MSAKITISLDKRNKNSPHLVRWRGDEINRETGTPRCYCKSFRTKTEAKEFKAEKMVEFKNGTNLDKPGDITLNSYRKDWLRVKNQDLRAATLEIYENTFDRLVGFFGGNCPLKKIKTKQARIFIVEQKNLTNKKELSDWSRNQIKRNCKSIFSMAVEDELLTKNPFGPIKEKKVTTKPWYRVNTDEYRDLLDVAPDLRTMLAYSLLYTTGLRLHEAYSLTWNSIDFEKGMLIVEKRQATSDIPPFLIKDHEARKIPLIPETINLLAEWQSQSPDGVPFVLLSVERFKLIQKKWAWLQKEGKPWRNRYIVNNVLRNFKKHYKRAGIKPVGTLTVHTLRKCAGQNWADILPMNVVKEFMGHSNIGTTAQFYGVVDEIHEDQARRKLQQRLENQSERYVKDTYERNLTEKEKVSNE